jgi:hypothetical protein
MREARLALLAIGIGMAPVFIKKSKPLARYVGDQLIKAGEYIKHGMEEDPIAAPPPVVTEEAVVVVEEAPAEVEAETPLEEPEPQAPSEPELEPSENHPDSDEPTVEIHPE